MTAIIGFVFLLVMVFGGYLIAGGKFGIILTALPFEMMMIGGAAIGSFIMANSMHDVKHTLGGFKKILKGPRYSKADYVEILSLLYWFVRLAQQKGAMALEAHIERPQESAAFQKFPKIAGDAHTVTMVCSAWEGCISSSFSFFSSRAITSSIWCGSSAFMPIMRR